MIKINVFQREYLDLKKAIDTKLTHICASGTYILGNEVECFEKEFAAYLGVKHVVGVGNGMEALQVGMMALGIGKGDEVITTPLSAVASTLAITMLGAKPVFVDVDDYFHIDPDSIEKKITKKTKAILPVHLYGQAVDLEAIFTVAKNHKLLIIEDACQAHGATFQKKKLGSFGMFGAFSFYPTKNLGCYGDGGAIATSDDSLAARCRKLRNYGQKDRYIHLCPGINSRLDELQAGILRVKLAYLDSWNTKRRTIADYYTKTLHGVGDIETPKERSYAAHTYHQYAIRTKNRDGLLEFLNNHSIPALIHYPMPIYKQLCYKKYNRMKLPHVEALCGEIISLPIHPYMTEDEEEHVVMIIKKFFRSI